METKNHIPPNHLRVPTENLTRQWMQIEAEVMPAIQRVLRNGKYTLGPELTAFEQEFASYVGAGYAVGMASGTAALHLALLACGVEPGDEVISVANTFIATTFAITYTGATPVFVDVDSDTFNIDVAQIEAAITPRTKAILPVHLYGQLVNIEEVMRIARAHNLKVVEDCSHTHGATRNGRMAGSIADVGAFSLYPTKVMGAFGDGGVCTTSDPQIYEKMRQLRYMGQRTKYNHEILGYQERLDELQAAGLRIKLKYLDEWVRNRQRVADVYEELLGTVPQIQLPKVDPANSHAYYLYTIKAERRDELQAYLLKHEIGCYVVYPYTVPETGAYADLKIDMNNYPVTQQHQDQILCLPMFPELTNAEIKDVADTVRAFYAGE